MQERTGFKVTIGGVKPPMPEPPKPSFGSPMNPFKFLSWIPFLFTFGSVFFLALIVQLVYNIITKPNAPITYGEAAAIFLISLVAAIAVGLLAKYKAEREARLSHVKIL
tara:strand:- start:1759 stop:2085 length:327 start_codon:yes stop_codon:yes gene_type:complete